MKDKQMKKKKYIPSSFLVIISIMVAFIVASWIGQGLSSDITGVGLLDIFTSIWHGFKDKADVILFIFSIGGTLGVMTKIKSIDAGIDALVGKLGNKVWLLIPVLMFVFGMGGTSYGMWEETIAFIPVLIPVFKKAGYGAFTAILVILMGSGIGCLASTVNPFSVGAAVAAINDNKSMVDAGISITSGVMQGTRWVSFFIYEIVGILMVTLIAAKYKKGIGANMKTDFEAKEKWGYTKKSGGGFIESVKGIGVSMVSSVRRGRIVDGLDNKLIESRFKEVELIEFTRKRKLSLALFVLAFVLMIIMYLPWGNWISDLTTPTATYEKYMFWFASTKGSGYAPIGDWYFTSVAALFLIVAVLVFAMNVKEFKSENENVEEGFISSYMAGVKDVLTVCLLIGTAAGLGSILNATGFGKFIADKSARGLTSWVGFGIVIFIISIILSMLVPSTSGFAAAFIPIFANIAVTAFPGRETTAIGLAMMGFLFASGIANLITPTSAALMGYTAYAGVPYNVWIKQTWKITLSLFIVGFVLILAFSLAAAGGSALF
ncbi:hypothetical protein [Candidatus Mycoplasma mahonii]|uniref:hypothetical protein n=1 Tax=Candidatus Mycoplasma mahonii TaxID=3004105 RepID=UPI0026EAA8C9|nr:hypothetical protein [Candidatus Mycoplasma mahonii]WKX02572.1 hypothetical protein O3I44_00635 [Candidatus Mycoplasma mahonii]